MAQWIKKLQSGWGQQVTRLGKRSSNSKTESQKKTQEYKMTEEEKDIWARIKNK